MINILHVDDDNIDHELVKANLNKISEKIQIHWVDSAIEALEVLRKKPFDCILCDYQMPGMDGLEFMHALRQNNNHIPLIFLTGQGNEQLAAEAFRSGANDYYTKEISFAHYERLLQSIRNVIRAYDTQTKLESERRYLESLLECSPVAIALTKTDSELVEVNPKFTELFGYSQEECAGQQVNSFLVPEQYSDEANELTEKVKHVEFGPVESYRIHKNKELIPVSIQGSPIRNKNGEIIGAYAIYLDIRERKVAEAVQKRLVSVINNTNVFIAIFTLEGSLNYLNKAGQRMVGLDNLALVGDLSLADFIPGSVLDQLSKSKLTELFKNGQFTGDHTITNKITGKRIEVEFSLFPIHSSETKEIQNLALVLRDVSERVKAERRLRESEENFRRIVENTENIIFKINQEGIFELSEGKGLSALNLKPGQVVGMSAFEIYKEYPEIAKKIRKALEGHDFSDESMVLVDGKEVHYKLFYSPIRDSTGNVTACIGESVNITEQKKSVSRLQASEERFRLLYERAPLAYQSLDDRGNIIEINQTWLDTLGHSRDEVIGKWLGDFIDPDHINTFKKNFPRFKFEGDISGVQLVFLHKDGHLVEVEIHGKVSYDKEGNFEKTHCIMHDITEKKSIMSKLEESERQLNLAFEASNEGMFNWNMKTGETYFNPQYMKMLGYEPNELPASVDTVMKLIHPEDKDVLLNKIDEISKGIVEEAKLEIRLRAKSNEWRWISSTSKVVEKNSDNLPIRLIGTHRDITDRKIAEEKLLNKTTELSDRVKELDCLYNISSLAADQNASVEEILQGIVDAMPPAWRYPEIASAKIQMNEQEFTSQKFKDSKWKQTQNIVVNNKIIGTVEVCYSEQKPESREGPFIKEERALINAIAERIGKIIEFKRIEEALVESEKQHRIVSDTMAQGIIFQNKDGVITHANPAAERILGLTSEQMQGRSSIDPRWRSIHEDGSDFPGDVHPTMVALKTGGKVDNVVMGIYNPKIGDTKWILLNAVPLFKDEEKMPYQVYATFTDITERKRIEEEIQNNQERLAAANKDLEAFTSSVSHDLKAPLRHIIGYSSILVESCENKLDVDDLNYLKKIKKSSERMGELIDDLLSISRVNKGEMKVVDCDLSEMANTIVKDLKKEEPERKEDIYIQENMTAKADKALLRSVLVNILGNAWKFSKGQNVTKIEFAEKTVKGTKTFYVRDSGVGFDSEYADNLFTPFQRFHSSSEFEGTGIGLATVQRIIHRHGGKIWAESKTDKGATFYFTIK